MSFAEKLETTIAVNQSLLVVALAPNPEIDRPRIPWHDRLSEIVEQTSDRVAAYRLALGYYLALGVRGIELLEHLLAAIPATVPIILDAKHGDLNTSTVLAQTFFEQWQVDAVTLNPYPGQDAIAPFLVYPDKAVFIVCRTSNPTAAAIQDYPDGNVNPLYLQIVRQAKSWGTPTQVGLEVGTTRASVLGKIRAIAPERLLLARSIWGAADLAPILAAGLDKNGAGLLVPVPLESMNQESICAEIDSLNQQITPVRESVEKAGTTSCELWMPNVCWLQPHPHQDLILQLFDLECILFGDYIQASGARSSYYIDLRKIISNPQVFEGVIHAYAEILQTLHFDRLAGIPYGALPTATGLAMHLQRPMIFPRKEVKAHGTRRLVEGHFESGETAVVVDDVLISGNSATEGAEKLRSVGLQVNDIVVFIDHEQAGAKERLGDRGFNLHAVLTLSEIATTLYEAGRIDREFAVLS